MTETKSYIALEYVDGISFERLIAEHGALPWRWAAEAVLQVLSALNAIHEKNIIHRDIKPANCLNAGRHKPLSQPPRTKLVDFGIATLTDSIGSATPTGTPAYSSPEQASGRKIDCRSDIYSVGATFYELMCGRPPNRSTYRPPSSENTAAGIPPEIDQVIHKALAGDPAERHESAVAFADDLRFAISANAVPGTLVSPTWFEPPVGAIAGEPLAMHQNEQLLRLRRRVEVFWVAGVLGPVVDWMALARQRRTLELDWVAGLGAELQGGQPVEIAPECSLEDLYKAQGRTLLILGGPGSGKTTQLLLLARHLLREGEPAVATIFTLSGWARRRSSLDDWMGEELHTKYQVPRTLAGIWIASHQIIPLLDGLDDIAVADRGACIRAINEFAARAGPDMPGLIVTSRLDEYSAVADRLSLGAAVCLHSLDQSSIVEYLGRYAEGGEKQRRLLQSEFGELIKTPLGLTLLASLDPHQVEKFGSKRERESDTGTLWDAYLKLMVARSGKRRLPTSPDRLLRVLGELSRAMKRQRISLFHLDDLQPSVLAEGWLQTLYFLSTRIAGGVVWGAGTVLAIGQSPVDNLGLHADLGFGVTLGLAAALGCGLTHGIWMAMRSRSQQQGIVRAHWVRVLVLSLLGGLVTSALVCRRGAGAGILGFEVGMFAGPLLSPHSDSGWLYADIRPADSLAFSLRNVARTWPYAVAFATFVATLGVAVKDLRALTVVVVYVLAMWVLLSGLQSRAMTEGVLPNAAIIRSLRSAAVLATIGFALTAAALGTIYGAAYGACAGLTTASIMWLWFGGFAAIEHSFLRLFIRLVGESFCDVELLDAAADRGLLHRIAVGYLFVHPTLQDHLSLWTTEDVERGSASRSQGRS